MPGLGDTLTNFSRYRKQFEAMGASAAGSAGGSENLVDTVEFGTNPGNLLMRSFVPDFLPPSAPLVVVLHGCTQTAASYDHGTGWTTLAAKFGFAVLLPEQQRANNPNLCFNWFLPEDTRRDQGEMLSIRQMIDRMILDHGLDPARVFVTGLSAGGAMTSSLLACYPEIFAAGAIIAGLPYGCATNTQEALACMFQGGSRTRHIWGDMVREASPHAGPWPRVSVWQGSADTTVKPSNAAEIVKQWLDLHGCPAEPSSKNTVSGVPHRAWLRDGEPVVEAYSIAGMGHGTPIDPAAADPDDRCGVPGPHILDAGISSTAVIARSWGLLEHRIAEAPSEQPAASRSKTHPALKRFDVGGVIEKALRAAGLMGRD
ncbi:MAG TPA: PHB depolymerase family esterase [Aliidongia sp.]|uniref:extracellular catalytic domain type 1 short-chain-length polyhydroxyalkanoate depolymerase n=1 Tax=Aliidongia sp. TaxID=1914230 RepID=UPI002DDD0F3F|nr:PHB depolymerase family esterase [Aliidongia sp.]HEV2675403.1 PHB depolymerase family esterase [Aliidongia sp.]